MPVTAQTDGGLKARRGLAITPLPLKKKSLCAHDKSDAEVVPMLCSSGELDTGGKLNCDINLAKKNKIAKHSTSATNEKMRRSIMAKDEVTTLMIRNLPYTLSLEELLMALDATGFKDMCDYCYLPHNFLRHTNQGFAFVNFISVEATRAFMVQWQGSNIFRTVNMRKTLNISAAAVQGREDNFKAAIKNMGRVKNASFRPWMPDACLQPDVP
jgi:hypothetical protein